MHTWPQRLGEPTRKHIFWISGGPVVVAALNEAHVLALKSAHVLRINKADILALNKAHVLRLNS